MLTIDPDLLRILVCPIPECRGGLEQQADRLVCRACGARYRIEERWPVLIPEEAEVTPPQAEPPSSREQ